MNCLNVKKMRLLVLGFIFDILASSGQLAIADFVICDPKPIDEAVNSQGAVHPSGCNFLPDGLKLYFGQGRGPDNSNDRDLWVAERESPDAPWGEAVNLGSNINIPGGKASDPAISPDDLELYFTHRYNQVNRLMRSTRASKDESWGPAAEFTGLGDAWSLDFASDGLSVYFDSRRSGGHGGKDIWVATRATTEDDWGEAVNLGPNVNDSDSQNNPSISNDGLALFFVNWTTRRMLMCIRATADDGWSPAIDLGPAVNGQASWVARPEICPDGSTLYFDSAVRLNYPELFWQVSVKPIVDFDDNGSVGMDDLLTMIGAWGTYEPLCDIGPMPWGDGVVDEADLEILMEHWGEIKPVIVHNFENYTGEEGNEIWNTWWDGWEIPTNGSSVGNTKSPFVELNIVHSGLQSMPFFYDDTTAPISETTREWEVAQDWTRRNVDILSLWFHGDPGNAIEPFYVALEDSAGNRKEAQHPNPAAVTIDHWEQWTIPLADFTGVDPTTIKIMGIGVGDPASNQPGGSGLVCIDDIELHSSSGQ